MEIIASKRVRATKVIRARGNVVLAGNTSLGKWVEKKPGLLKEAHILYNAGLVELAQRMRFVGKSTIVYDLMQIDRKKPDRYRSELFEIRKETPSSDD